ncbi:MAG: hypothetical protein KAI47_01805 [Deltaproteobacteria bacterium]|nr:hypothetical protein [Deltaproteobacteria bacterium]
MKTFLVLLTALMLTTSGCYKATFVRPVPPSGVEKTEWLDFFLWGVANTETIDIRRFCPKGNIRSVRVGGNFGTLLVTIFTGGLYSPRKLYVQCAMPAVAR